MLAIFHKAFAHPPEELNSPASLKSSKKPKLPEEALQEFLSSHPTNTFSMSFGDAAVLAYVRPDHQSLFHQNQRLFCGYDDIYCLFMGNLNNLSAQIKQYGLARNANEAMLVIEAYRTLRDRGPYPADQVIKDLEGSFAFVVYDSKVGTVFTALVFDPCLVIFDKILAFFSVYNLNYDFRVLMEELSCTGALLQMVLW
ncbi:stem-specific TSJT1-like [Olea europaea subsp. europaea]|uniref:Stem-specific TSJT1-like n=1 Tax=Olea europaea subsp. europaea TaxID=158383 RepID=A0A8S0R4E6_OLEEU|nr:stem-specific TSJT1-like [Olea europaea subsp. europaea]